jgi:hypothetical protein
VPLSTADFNTLFGLAYSRRSGHNMRIGAKHTTHAYGAAQRRAGISLVRAEL